MLLASLEHTHFANNASRLIVEQIAGAVYANDGNLAMSNCTIRDNSATDVSRELFVGRMNWWPLGNTVFSQQSFVFGLVIFTKEWWRVLCQ